MQTLWENSSFDLVTKKTLVKKWKEVETLYQEPRNVDVLGGFGFALTCWHTAVVMKMGDQAGHQKKQLTWTLYITIFWPLDADKSRTLGLFIIMASQAFNCWGNFVIHNPKHWTVPQSKIHVNPFLLPQTTTTTNPHPSLPRSVSAFSSLSFLLLWEKALTGNSSHLVIISWPWHERTLRNIFATDLMLWCEESAKCWKPYGKRKQRVRSENVWTPQWMRTCLSFSFFFPVYLPQASDWQVEDERMSALKGKMAKHANAERWKNKREKSSYEKQRWSWKTDLAEQRVWVWNLCLSRRQNASSHVDKCHC